MAPELVDVCTDLCAQMETVDGCSLDVDACIDTCRLRECDICPGTLEPLTRCRVDEFDPTSCTCAGDKVECELPAACEDEEAKTSTCGG